MSLPMFKTSVVALLYVLQACADSLCGQSVKKARSMPGERLRGIHRMSVKAETPESINGMMMLSEKEVSASAVNAIRRAGAVEVTGMARAQALLIATITPLRCKEAVPAPGTDIVFSGYCTAAIHIEVRRHSGAKRRPSREPAMLWERAASCITSEHEPKVVLQRALSAILDSFVQDYRGVNAAR